MNGLLIGAGIVACLLAPILSQPILIPVGILLAAAGCWRALS